MFRRGFLKSFAAAMGISSVKEIKAVELLEMKPSDALVLTFHRKISAESAAQLQEQWQVMHGGAFKGIPLIVLQDGAELKVIRGLKRGTTDPV